MAQQLQQAIPDKQTLATVLSYLRDKRLKETEEVLKRELGLEGVSPMDTSSASSSSPHLPPVPQSDTEPAKYHESYSRLAPTSSPSTEADLQPTVTNQPPDQSLTGDTTIREPLQSDQEDEQYSEDEHEIVEDEEDGDDDIADSTDMVSIQTNHHRPLSWPGSLPQQQQHAPLKFPRPEQVVFNNLNNLNKASLRAKISPSSTSVPAPLGAAAATPLGTTAVPLWATSNALKPLTVTTSPAPTPSLASSSSSSIAARLDAPQSVIYSMLNSHSVSQQSQPLITPLFTIVPSTALVSTTATSGIPTTKPLLRPSPPPLIVSPQGRPTTLPALTRPINGMTLPRRESASSPRSPQAEPATGQTITPPVNVSPRTLGSIPAQRTLASIPPSEMTPHYMELKAFAEEFKTKRIRLGYTQGSVGQSLARRGYSNFAQSTISRFEQMQLSATNAAAIKQVLEKWLQETEFPESVTSSSTDIPVMASRKRKKRAVFTPQTKSTLEEFFRQNPRPNRQAIESIAHKLDLLPEEVRVWFCNKRQKQKQSSTSSVSSYYSTVSSPASSNSPGSSGFVAVRSPSLSPRRCSPSPKTSFTIEELSKSANSTSSTPSPVLLTSPFSISPSALSISASGGVFPLVLPTNTLTNMTAQTQA